LRRGANPTDIVPEAEKRGLDPKMCASYTDGTKLCVEQALIANALGLRTAVPGMLGPRADNLMDVFRLFDLETLWRDRTGITDYVLGPRPKGGVFLIGYNDHPYQKFMLDWFPSELGPGPFYLFQRPYHLIHIEAMATIAEAVLDGTSLLAPWKGLRTDVYAYAKRGLKAGERLDGIGGYACYGLIENCADQVEAPGLPIAFSDDLVLRRDVPVDGKILRHDVEIPSERVDFRTYELAREASRRMEA
jgi:predicted homoserine dehydrogenase-like protein